jgi:hypothetical protein
MNAVDDEGQRISASSGGGFQDALCSEIRSDPQLQLLRNAAGFEISIISLPSQA